jgi:hypothetical protein
MRDDLYGRAHAVALTDLDLAAEDDDETPAYLADRRQRLARGNCSLIAEPPEPLDFRRLQSWEHLVAPRISDGWGDCSHVASRARRIRRVRRIEMRRLRLQERAKLRRPSFLEVDVLLKPALHESLDSPLRFRPRQRPLKGREGVEQPVGGWQRDLVDKGLARRNSTSVEGGDPARESIDEGVKLCIRKRPIDVSVSLCGVTVEIVGSENNFEGAATADQMGEALGTAAAGMHANPYFGLA